MDLPLPDTFGPALRWFVVGTIIFALGFEGIVMLWDGRILLSIISIASAIGLLAIIVYWPVLPSALLIGMAVIAASPAIFYATIKICRHLKLRGEMLLNIGIILIFAALLTAVVGGALIYIGAVTNIQAGPSGGNDNSFKTELDATKQELTATKRELEATKRQLAARQPTELPSPPSIPGQNLLFTPPPKQTIESLNQEKTRTLVTELYKLKNILPQIEITRGPAPYSHDLSTFANVFERAGILVETGMQKQKDQIRQD
jgi:hypothetical protein